ncbi:MAG: hypothetical protein QF371_05330, partial [Flavobacteriales bacterium]|nr:hypothetical protein [Flavobacteriales bacterium]
SGNVGIGITTPAQELHVVASSGNADLRLALQGSGNYMDVHSGLIQGLWGVGNIDYAVWNK